MITSAKAVGALVDMPFDLYGIKKGLHILALPDRPVIHNTTLLATSDYIKENPETVDAFLKGFIEALHFFKTKPQEVVPILKRNLAARYGLQEDEYYVHLQREWAKLLNKNPYPLPAAIQNVYDLDVGKDPKMHHIGPMEPWDLHYLRKIETPDLLMLRLAHIQKSHAPTRLAVGRYFRTRPGGGFDDRAIAPKPTQCTGGICVCRALRPHIAENSGPGSPQ
jgi:hypothetical protein